MSAGTFFLREIGDVEQIKKLSIEAEVCKKLPANTHIHLPPNFSAFGSVEQAVEKAASENIKVLGVGNYYDFSVYDKFVALAREKNIFPLFGTEIIALEKEFQKEGIRINDPGNPGKFYICGKSISKFEDMSLRAKELISYIRSSDAKRMEEMANKLGSYFKEKGVDISLGAESIIERLAEKCKCDKETITLQERHLSQGYQEEFFRQVPADQRAEKFKILLGSEPASDVDDAVGVQNELRSKLLKAGKPCFVDEEFVSLSQAKELICELGGIVCYPVLADGAKERCEYEQTPAALISKLRENNIKMVEFIPNRNSREVLGEYVKSIRQAGIIVVAGTEHNTQDLIDIAPKCKDGEIPEDVEEIFTEGTCVCAGHQFMAANGECGYVDGEGNLNSEYSDDSERIEAFAKTGSAVLERYFK